MVSFIEFATRESVSFRGDPLLEIDAVLSDGAIGRTIVPCRTDYTDEQPAAIPAAQRTAFWAQEIALARESCRRIAAGLAGTDACGRSVDRAILQAAKDTEQSAAFNVSLGFSLAAAKAAAASRRISCWRYLGGVDARQMPLPQAALLGGGRDAGNNLDFREFMIVPLTAAPLAEHFRMCTDVYHAVKRSLAGGRAVFAENGILVPNLLANEEALAVLRSAIEQAGYQPGKQLALAINVAASDCFHDGEYHFWREGSVKTPAELVGYYRRLAAEYPLIAIEDGVADEDREGWWLFRQHLGGKVQLLSRRLLHARIGLCRTTGDVGISIPVTRFSSVSGLLHGVKRLKNAGYPCVLANSAGAMEASIIADIAMAAAADRIKLGPPVAHQAAVYNQLLRIEEEWKTAASGRRCLCSLPAHKKFNE